MAKVLGVLGGMGPQATVDFMQKLVDFCNADGDGGHLRVIVDSHPQIPDRTAAILRGGASPVPAMGESLANLARCGVQVVAMPCVTAHYFLRGLNIPPDMLFLNMPQIAADVCARRFAGAAAGVLATPGTAAAGVVDAAFTGTPLVYPDDNDQERLWRLIKDVKAKRPLDAVTVVFDEIVRRMKERGADYFLLACTEVPIIAAAYDFPFAYVDCTAELARVAVAAVCD